MHIYHKHLNFFSARDFVDRLVYGEYKEKGKSINETWYRDRVVEWHRELMALAVS